MQLEGYSQTKNMPGRGQVRDVPEKGKKLKNNKKRRLCQTMAGTKVLWGTRTQ